MEFSDQFQWPDYFVLAAVLAVSTLIGVYHGCRRGGQRTTDDYLMAGRDMRFLPVAFSVLASFLSAISVIGLPVEIYMFGASFWMNSLSYFISIPITAHVFIPLFHRLKLRTVYEYLELRFSYTIRVLGCVVFSVQMMAYMAVAFYAPALAFSQVSGLSMWMSVLAVGVVCTIYTTLGGLKAVIWTDVFQMLVVISGVLALIIRGTIEMGGASAVWQKATDGGRLHVLNFDPNPLIRHTFWTLVFGGSVTTLSVYAVNQAMVQRYLCVKKLKHAQGTIYFNLPSNIITTTLLTALGLVAYAKYKDCDPIRSKRITRGDQLVPLFVVETLGIFPGLPGLFVACVFSAALSTVSSGVNALALVYLEDIIRPGYKILRGSAITERIATITSKLLALFFGFLTVGLAFLAGVLGKTILNVTLRSFGITGGPLLGLFVLAIFFPSSNTLGAMAGLLCSLLFSFWVGVGAIMNPSNDPFLSLKTDGCHVTPGDVNMTYKLSSSFTSTVMTSLSNFSMNIENSTSLGTPTNIKNGYTSLDLYRLSYLWYSASSVLVAVIVGLIVSVVTGGSHGRPVNPALVIPLWDKVTGIFRRNQQKYVIASTNSKTESHSLPLTSSTDR